MYKIKLTTIFYVDTYTKNVAFLTCGRVEKTIAKSIYPPRCHYARSEPLKKSDTRARPYAIFPATFPATCPAIKPV